MQDANVPDIAIEPDKTVKKVQVSRDRITRMFWSVFSILIPAFQDRFHLELSDEEAVKCMGQLIDVSISATMPAIMERMHQFTQASSNFFAISFPTVWHLGLLLLFF